MKIDNQNESLISKLQAALESSKKKPSQIAAELNESRQTVRSWFLTGRVAKEKLSALAQCLGVELAELISEDENNKVRIAAVSERLRIAIQSKFPTKGRFEALEKVSGINQKRWENFYYRRNNASVDMVNFWLSKYPEDDTEWITTGDALEQLPYPFSSTIAKESDRKSIAERLIWVIYEFASPRGEELFNYLEQRYKKSVSAQDWAKLILEKIDPTAEMVRLICNDRPMFTEWVIRGSISRIQINPADKNSIMQGVNSLVYKPIIES